jgi:hypothetical protein
MFFTGSAMLAATTYAYNPTENEPIETLTPPENFPEILIEIEEPTAVAIVVGESKVQEEERLALEKAKAEERQRPKPVVKKVTPTKTTPTGSNSVIINSTSANLCSCVLFAKAKSGRNPGSVGFARNWPVNSQTPQVGAVILTRESSAGHAGVVTGVDSEWVYVNDANYSRCRETNRKLPINSHLIRGYYL